MGRIKPTATATGRPMCPWQCANQAPHWVHRVCCQNSSSMVLSELRCQGADEQAGVWTTAAMPDATLGHASHSDSQAGSSHQPAPPSPHRPAVLQPTCVAMLLLTSVKLPLW